MLPVRNKIFHLYHTIAEYESMLIEQARSYVHLEVYHKLRQM